MKNIFIIFLFIFCLGLPVFAGFKSIPSSEQHKYKIEIENIINSEYPMAKRKIKNISDEVKNEKNSNQKQTIIEQGIAEILFEFYQKLVYATEKYAPISKNVPSTDWYGEMQKQLNPYFEDANINVNKINKLLDFAKQKQYQFEQKYIYR